MLNKILSLLDYSILGISVFQSVRPCVVRPLLSLTVS